MMLKTIKILPFMLASVNPSSFKLEQPKKAQQNFTLNIPYETASTNNTTIDGLRIDFRKENGTAYNSALAVNANRYIQTTRNGTNITDEIILPTEQTLNTSQFISVMYAIQITPYANIVDAEATTVINVFLNNTIYINPDTNANRLSLRYRALTSTDTYWQTYIDISNYNTNGVNYDIYNDLTNAQNGFIYNETLKIKDFTTNPYNTTQTEKFEIQIVKDKTNYIYVLVEPYIREYTSTPYITINGAQDWTNNRNNNLFQISGTEIIGNLNYEVIDVPGIMWEVLSMPFTFISIAFNLTLFPGTPYQVNLSNLFLSILGALIFIFIMNKFVFRR